MPWPSSVGAPFTATLRSSASVYQGHRGTAASDERSAACGGVNADAGAGALKRSLGALALGALLMGDVAPALAAASTMTVAPPAVVRTAGLPSSLSVADADTGAAGDAAPAAATAADVVGSAADSAPKATAGKSRRYINLTGFPFPLGPFVERPTVATTIVPGKVYSFEQEQALSGITANVRSVVFRMRDDHLLVYNPVAPTDEVGCGFHTTTPHHRATPLRDATARHPFVLPTTIVRTAVPFAARLAEFEGREPHPAGCHRVRA